MDRQTAYSWVQKASHRKKSSLKEELSKNALLKKHLTVLQLEKIFSGESRAIHIGKVIDRKLKEWEFS